MPQKWRFNISKKKENIIFAASKSQSNLLFLALFMTNVAEAHRRIAAATVRRRVVDVLTLSFA
jgi:hypothetical protein